MFSDETLYSAHLQRSNHGAPIAYMQNHHIAVTGKYYFPGLCTAILSMIPGGYSVWWFLKQQKEIP